MTGLLPNSISLITLGLQISLFSAITRRSR